MSDLPKETEAKLIEAMISEFWKQGLNHDDWRNHMQAALAVAVPVIRDAVLEEAAIKLYIDDMDLYGAVRREAAREIRAMKGQADD